MSLQIKYVGDEKQKAMAYVQSKLEKFIAEGKITHLELNKGLFRFINDQSARSFIGEIRERFDKGQVSINFEKFYKSHR